MNRWAIVKRPYGSKPPRLVCNNEGVALGWVNGRALGPHGARQEILSHPMPGRRQPARRGEITVAGPRGCGASAQDGLMFDQDGLQGITLPFEHGYGFLGLGRRAAE